MLIGGLDATDLTPMLRAKIDAFVTADRIARDPAHGPVERAR